jgi:hypothetical protein
VVRDFPTRVARCWGLVRSAEKMRHGSGAAKHPETPLQRDTRLRHGRSTRARVGQRSREPTREDPLSTFDTLDRHFMFAFL